MRYQAVIRCATPIAVTRNNKQQLLKYILYVNCSKYPQYCDAHVTCLQEIPALTVNHTICTVQLELNGVIMSSLEKKDKNVTQ